MFETLTLFFAMKLLQIAHLITMLYKQTADMPPRESVGVCDINTIFCHETIANNFYLITMLHKQTADIPQESQNVFS